jgi:hypothetical protein
MLRASAVEPIPIRYSGGVQELEASTTITAEVFAAFLMTQRGRR